MILCAMRFTVTGLLAVAVCAIGTARAADLARAKPESVGLSSARLQRIASFYQDLVDRQQVGGAQFLVARRGKVAYFESVGFADVEERKKMDDTTIFRIYSMTKPITGVALLMLYEQGMFQLTDPVSRYIPEFADLQVLAGIDAQGGMLLEQQKREMTVQDMLRHTAGFSYGFTDENPVDKLYTELDVLNIHSTLQQMIGKLAKIPLLFQPGRRWHYSVAVDVQGYLVEKLSGMPFDEFLETRLFDPLEMHDTAFFVNGADASRLAKTYTVNEQGQLVEFTEPWINDFYEKPALPSGGGGLVSTSADYWRFAQMLANGGELDGVRILGRKTVDYMTSDHLPATAEEPTAILVPGVGFGLGVAVVIDPALTGQIASRGSYFWGGLACTSFWIDPLEELVAILMTQYLPATCRFREDIDALVYQAIVD